MKSTLVLFAHPYLEYSNSNRELLNFYERHHHFAFRDLYEEYPDFHISAFKERKRLKNYERIIFHFPLIWFGVPPLLKLWIDEVLNRSWLHSDQDNPLEGKEIFILVTTGGKERSFGKNCTYEYTVEELISGLTVSLKCFHAVIKEIMVVYEVEKLSKKEIIAHKQKFVELLKANE